MSSYAKRRSAQRASVASSGSATAKDSPPRSPEFGVGSSAAAGGSTGEREEPDVGLDAGSANAVLRPRVSRSAFDERVRDVRNRLQQMMENGGDDRHDDGSSDGSDQECDTPPEPVKKPSARGSNAGRAVERPSITITAAEPAAEPTDEPEPADKQFPSSSGSGTTRPQAKASVTAGRRRSPPGIALDSDIQFQVENKMSSSAVSSRASAGRMTVPDISNDSPIMSSASLRVNPDAGSSLPVIGRDAAAKVGQRIRVIDPNIARCVEPTGVINEIRCEGARVRVEHDGKDHPQRYYNTGKGGKYDLVLESGTAEESLAPASTKERHEDSKVKPRTSKTGSRPSRASLAPPDIPDDDEEEPEESESRAEVQSAPRKSRYSEIRTARRQSKALGANATTEEPTQRSGSAASRSKTAPVVQEQSSSGEPAPRSRYSERRSLSKSNAEPDPAEDAQSVSTAPRAKTVPKKRSSMPNPSPTVLSDNEPDEKPKSYAARRSTLASPRGSPQPDPVGSDVESAPAPRRYSERRRATSASPAPSQALLQAPMVQEETQSVPTSQEAAPQQKRYSERRKSLRTSQVDPSPAGTDTLESAPSVSTSARQEVKGQQISTGAMMNASSGREQTGQSANDGDEKAKELVDKLKQENEAFRSRLQHLEETLSRDLRAVKDDVHSQIGAAENKIVARVLEELENRIRQGAISAAGKIMSGSMDAKVANKLKSMGQLDMDACNNEPAPQPCGTPVNEEPEQELMAGGDVSDGSTNGGYRRGSSDWKSLTFNDQSSQKCFQKPTEMSNAELADNRQRLESIGNAARRASANLGGGMPTDNYSNYPPQSMPRRDGMQTPDFASQSFHALHAPPPPQDNLDQEMEHLAEMRRFASSVLNHASALAASAQPQDHSMPPTGTMPHPWETNNSPRTSVNNSVCQPPESHLQAARRQSALRDAASVDQHADLFNAPPRGFDVRDQQPPAQPPGQGGPGPPSAMRQWMNGGRSVGSARRSTSTPMCAAWPGAAGYEAEGDGGGGGGGSGGRLVF